MGRVYRAEDPDLGRVVALKLANDDSDIALMRFTGEAQAQARIGHPNVVKVFEVGEVQGRPFIVMQYIEGMDLASAAARLDLRQLVRIMRQVAEGAEAAHRLGLLHRDLKPQNILVEGVDTDEPHAFVTDFGLVKSVDTQGLTATGITLGTLRYMSPEQVLGGREELDARSDVYSLGATMYEVFGGGPLHGGVSEAQLLRKILEDDPSPLRRVAPKVPEDLARIVHTCLAREPERRYPSGQALAEDLGRYLNGQPIWARRPSLAYRFRTVLNRHRALAILASVSVSALLVLGLWSMRSLSRSRRRAELATEFGQRAQRMETILRLAYMSPEHILTPQIDATTQEIARLQTDMHQGGTAAQGSGYWAMGEGYLALNNTDEALRCFDKAWALGFQTPESAFARGQALVRKYANGRDALAGIADETQRAAESEKLEIKFRKPALEMLRRACNPSGAGLLAIAQISMLEAREDEALRQADAVLSSEPWRYEACVLQMDIWRLRRDRAYANRDGDAFQHAQEQIEAAFDKAKAIAPSAFDLWVQFSADCLDRPMDEGLPHPEIGAEAWLERCITCCNRALALYPAETAALNNRSEAEIRIAYQQHLQGKPPEAWLQRAITDAEASIRIRPNQARSQFALSRALLTKANLLVDAHREAGPELRSCLEAIQHGKALAEQADPAVVAWEAMVLALDGTNATNHGRDGRPLFREALRTIRQVGVTDSSFVMCMGLKGSFGILLADAEDRSGADPAPVLEEAQAALEALLGKDPKHVQALHDCAEVHRIRASSLVRKGQDPGEEMLLAQRLLSRGLAENPAFHELHQVKGRMGLVLARWNRHSPKREAAFLAMAKASLLKAKALNPRIMDLDSDLQELATMEAARSEPGFTFSKPLVSENASMKVLVTPHPPP
jgi:serine/threonine-protein kinase